MRINRLDTKYGGGYYLNQNWHKKFLELMQASGSKKLNIAINRRLVWWSGLVIVIAVLVSGIIYWADIVYAAPSITLSGTPTTDGDTTVTVNTTEIKPGTQRYLIITGNTAPTVCNASTGNYASFGVGVTFYRQDRVWVCYRGENANVAGAYIYSSPLEVPADNIAPRGMSVTLDTTTSVFTASSISNDLHNAWRHSWKKSTDFACDNTVTNWGNGNAVNSNPQDLRSTLYLCFRAQDKAGNYGYYKYVHSPTDSTPPTITTSKSGNTATASSAAGDLDAGTWKHHVKSGGTAPTCNSSLSYSRSGSTYTRTGTGLEHVCFTVSDTSGNAGYSSVVTLAAVTDTNPRPNPNPTPNPNTPQNPDTHPDTTPDPNPDTNTDTNPTPAPNTDSSSNTNNNDQPAPDSNGGSHSPAPDSNGGSRSPAPATRSAEQSNRGTPRQQTEGRSPKAETEEVAREQQSIDETATTAQTQTPPAGDSRSETKQEADRQKDVNSNDKKSSSGSSWLWLVLLLLAAGVVAIIYFKNKDGQPEEPEEEKKK